MTDEPSAPPGRGAGFADLGLRVASGLVLGLVAVAAVWAGGPWFCALIAIMALIMVFEYDRLCLGLGPMAAVHAVAALGAVGLAAAGLPAWAGAAVLAGVALSAVLAPVLALPLSWAVIGPVYVGVPCIAMIWLRLSPFGGAAEVYWLLIVISAMDTGAYLAGRTFGGPRLAPRISPKKTWAGLIGGAVSAAALGSAAAFFLGFPAISILGVAAALIGIWSQVGDMCESAVKRHFGVKDSSGLIPGHGGLLDRVDGLLFAAPLAALAVSTGLV